MKNLFVFVLFALSTTALLVACGDDSSSSSSFDCCLNGAYYQCEDADEFDTCNLSDGASACERDSSKDSECD